MISTNQDARLAGLPSARLWSRPGTGAGHVEGCRHERASARRVPVLFPLCRRIRWRIATTVNGISDQKTGAQVGARSVRIANFPENGDERRGADGEWTMHGLAKAPRDEALQFLHGGDESRAARAIKWTRPQQGVELDNVAQISPICVRPPRHPGAEGFKLALPENGPISRQSSSPAEATGKIVP